MLSLVKPIHIQTAQQKPTTTTATLQVKPQQSQLPASQDNNSIAAAVERLKQRKASEEQRNFEAMKQMSKQEAVALVQDLQDHSSGGEAEDSQP